MEITPESKSSQDIYKILIGTVLPRPIAWVSTVDPLGKVNLAPFSFFTVASVNPPILCFSPLLKEDSIEKDTLVNINQTREFVVNIVSEEIAGQMNETATDYPPEVDEFKVAGLTPVASEIVRPPRVKESPINLECQLYKTVMVGDGSAGSAMLIIGEIILYHIADSLLDEGRIDTGLLKPVGRLAGQEYTTLGRRFTLVRKTLT